VNSELAIFVSMIDGMKGHHDCLKIDWSYERRQHHGGMRASNNSSAISTSSQNL